MCLALFSLPGCDDFKYPRDPNETLDRVLASDRMRVAAVDHPPWVVIQQGGVPTGAEAFLVQAFARELGVAIEWRRAPAFEALEALKRGDADLAIGGFTRRAVEGHQGAAHTYAYFTEVLVAAAEPGTPIPDDLEGRKVYVPPDLMVNGLIEEREGIPVSQKTEDVQLVAIPNWQLVGKDLVPTGIVLQREKHVMAVPQGENAWVMRVERFLRNHAHEMALRLQEHVP